MMTFITALDFIKPVFQFVNILLMLAVAGYSFYSILHRAKLSLILVVIGSLLASLITSIWFVFALKTSWGISLFSSDTHRFLYIVISVLYPLEIVVWPIALISFAHDNLRASKNAEQDAAANP